MRGAKIFGQFRRLKQKYEMSTRLSRRHSQLVW
jgi:hypothetical protein